jgi:hypothetical protein
MADLGTRVLQVAARLWGKQLTDVYLEWQPEYFRAEVYAWVDDEDPDAGRHNRRVSIMPDSGVDPVTDPAYRTELLLALLDVLEGALRRKEAAEARVGLTLN